MKERFMVSDGMGGFLYADLSKDDKDFITIELEEEDENNNYSSRCIELHKEEIKPFINRLIELL